MTAPTDDETLLKVWAVSKGVKLDERIGDYNESILNIYRSAKDDTDIDMNNRNTGIDIMKAFCTLLYKKFFGQLNRKIKTPKTIGIVGTDVKSLEQLEAEKATTIVKSTTKIIKRVIKSATNTFLIGDRAIQNFIGCGFFPIGFVTKLFIFERNDGVIFVPRIAKFDGRKVIAFAAKIQEGYDFEKANSERHAQAANGSGAPMGETRQENPQSGH